MVFMAVPQPAERPATRPTRATPPAPVTRPRVPATAPVLAAIASVQVGAALARHLFARVGPTGMVSLRLVFAALILVAVARPALTAFDPRGRPRREIAALLGYAAVLAAMNWSFYEAIDRIPLGIAVTFEFLGPLGVALVGSAVGSPGGIPRGPLARLRDLSWAALAAAGVVLLGGFGDGSGGGGGGAGGAIDPVGIALALLAGAFWAAYILLSAQVGRAGAGLRPLAVALVLSALAVTPAGVLTAGTALLAPVVLLGGLGVALLSSALPYALELTALRRMSPSAFGVMMSLEPAAAALAGLVILGESLGPVEVLAIGLVTVASAGSTWSSSRAGSNPAPG